MTDAPSRIMSPFIRRLLFLLFFLSGFCSLVYQVIWTRLAFASFGIITPVLSVVLSVFMLGLFIGAWAGGRFIAPLVRRTGFSAVLFYGLAEALIGLGAFAVPGLFSAGEHFLLTAGETNSAGYLVWSALVLAFSILPWCVCMGATFPLMMAYVREQDSQNTGSFSYLYLANVLGAMSGTILTAIVLVEIFGFHHTLRIAAAGNFAIAGAGIGLGWKQRRFASPEIPDEPNPAVLPERPPSGRPRTRFTRWILFSTGFCAIAMEVIWTREFTPVLKTQVYSFAWFRNFLFDYMLWLHDGLILYSGDLMKNVPRRERHKAFPANNTINFEDFPEVTESKDEIKRQLGIPFKKTVLFAGRMDISGGRKRVDHLIEIFRDVNGRDAGLVIVGSGMKDEWRARMNPRTTIYLGEVHDPQNLQISRVFRMADVFAIPGHVGLGLNQAFYFGLPVVTEEGNHPPEIGYLQPSRNGFMVPGNNLPQLRKKLFTLLDNDALREEFSRNAREDILKNASVEGMYLGFRDCVRFLNGAKRETANPTGALITPPQPTKQKTA